MTNDSTKEELDQQSPKRVLLILSSMQTGEEVTAELPGDRYRDLVLLLEKTGANPNGGSVRFTVDFVK